jgi:predicted Zn-dependent protease
MQSLKSLIFLTIAVPLHPLCGEPFVPKDGQQVLERLRSAPLDPALREMRGLRKRLEDEPDNLAVASQLVRRCLERSRAETDPRFLGYAQAALARWWNEPRPPLEALVLRATLRQSQHDFTNALADLDLALHAAPTDAQAWLTRATILTVLGRYAEARRACLPLVRLAPELAANTAVANVTSLNGEAERSYDLLRRTLERNPSAETTQKLWALTLLAEISARLEHVTDADQFFRRALSLGQRDAYLLGAYADFLLDEGRAREAAALLKDETRADTLLLRLALAESVLDRRSAQCKSHVAGLRERFEASRLRGDCAHRREEARFTLYLLGQPQEALRLATANWQVQREPADARILLEAALAAQDPGAAQPVLDFVRNNHLEDTHLAKLVAALTNNTQP